MDTKVIRNRLLSRGEEDLAAAVEEATAKGGNTTPDKQHKAAVDAWRRSGLADDWHLKSREIHKVLNVHKIPHKIVNGQNGAVIVKVHPKHIQQADNILKNHSSGIRLFITKTKT